MRFHILICCLFLLFHLQLNAQDELVGLVTDIDNDTPLFYATVTLKIPKEDKILDFQFTDKNGKFQFSNPSSFLDSILLSASYLGFEQLDTLLFFPKNSSNPIHLKLSPKENQLEEIEVKAYKNGIIINGDTTSYDPTVFTNGSEENVEDVLKKIPGIDIDEDGKITVGNKEVKKVLVEGDKFLDENRKGILEGISAKDIAKIEVIANYQEFDDLAGIGNKKENQFALNIKLTEDAKSKFRANGNLAVGYKNKYETDWSAFKFLKKLKLFFDLNSNNTGQHTLTIHDYIKLEGGILKFGESHSKKDISIPKIFFQKNQRKAIQENYSSLNFSYQPSEKLNFNGFGFGYFGNSTAENNKEEIPLHSVQSNFYKTLSDNQLLLTVTKMNLEYKISKQSNIQFTNKVLGQKEKEDLTNLTRLSENNFSDLTNFKHDIFKLSNQINFRHLFNAQNHLSVQFFSKWERSERNRKIDSETFLPFSLQNGLTPFSDANQILKKEVADFDFNINYIRQKKNINLTSQVYWNDKEQLLTNTSDTPLNNIFEFSNESKVRQKFIGIKEEITYQKNLNNFGIGLNYFHLKTNQKNKDFIIPSAFIKLQFTKFHQNLSLSYNRKVESLNLPQAINSFEIQSLNKLYLFSLPYDQTTNGHHVDFFYTLFDAFSGTMFFAFSKYSNSEAIINRYEYFPTYEISESDISPNQELLISGIILDKKIYKYNIGIKSKVFLGFQNSYSYLSDNLLLNKNKNLRLDLKMYSAWSDSPINIEGGLNYKNGKSATQNNEVNSKELSPNLNLFGLHLNKKIKWKLGLISVNEKTSNQSNRYLNFNGYLDYGFSKSSSNSISLEFNDLLNITSPTRLSASQVGNNFLIFSNHILPGYILIKLKFKI